MDPYEEFDFWCGEYRDNPLVPVAEATRVLAELCAKGNPAAIRWWECCMRVIRRAELAEKGAQNTFPFAVDLDDPRASISWFASEEVSELDEADAADCILDTIEAGENGYAWNWPAIADEAKKKAGYKCADCNFFSYASPAMQVHHINGDKRDNRPENLEVLCPVCHGQRHSSGPLWTSGTTAEDKRRLRQYHARLRKANSR